MQGREVKIEKKKNKQVVQKQSVDFVIALCFPSEPAGWFKAPGSPFQGHGWDQKPWPGHRYLRSQFRQVADSKRKWENGPSAHLHRLFHLGPMKFSWLGTITASATNDICNRQTSYLN